MPDINIDQVDWEKGDGLVPAVIQDVHNGHVLMLGYMNQAALSHTLNSGKVTFFSRSKNRLWTKGETSGNWIDLWGGKWIAMLTLYLFRRAHTGQFAIPDQLAVLIISPQTTRSFLVNLGR